jgi:hypothetical protein
MEKHYSKICASLFCCFGAARCHEAAGAANSLGEKLQHIEKFLVKIFCRFRMQHFFHAPNTNESECIDLYGDVASFGPSGAIA